jgi:putative flavoprotein involved in K+ transport
MHPNNEADAPMIFKVALDVLVIGGGQAGLAVGDRLKQERQRFLIVDVGAKIGDAWRQS